jgi:hypothetical protein
VNPFVRQASLLSGTLTPIVAAIDRVTGRVDLAFAGISRSESSQSDWSITGVRSLGMFYFIKVRHVDWSIAGQVLVKLSWKFGQWHVQLHESNYLELFMGSTAA